MYINQSLSYLEQCVVALSRRNPGHVPYRQSKLTNVLKVRPRIIPGMGTYRVSRGLRSYQRFYSMSTAYVRPFDKGVPGGAAFLKPLPSEAKRLLSALNIAGHPCYNCSLPGP